MRKTIRRAIDVSGSSDRNWDKEFQSSEILTVQEPIEKQASNQKFI